LRLAHTNLKCKETIRGHSVLFLVDIWNQIVLSVNILVPLLGKLSRIPEFVASGCTTLVNMAFIGNFGYSPGCSTQVTPLRERS